MESTFWSEKSIALNSRELDEAIALADKKGVVIGEAMTIYHMPIYKKLKEILGVRETWKGESDYYEFWKLQRI